jgi:hypothetical protein
MLFFTLPVLGQTPSTASLVLNNTSTAVPLDGGTSLLMVVGVAYGRTRLACQRQD